jgi:hypothetical protein
VIVPQTIKRKQPLNFIFKTSQTLRRHTQPQQSCGACLAVALQLRFYLKSKSYICLQPSFSSLVPCVSTYLFIISVVTPSPTAVTRSYIINCLVLPLPFGVILLRYASVVMLGCKALRTIWRNLTV